MKPDADVIVIGGGPAGLNCALVLGRCRRNVILFDSGVYRNSSSAAIHGFLSRDGIAPLKMLAEARKQTEKYGVRFFNEAVTEIIKHHHGFTVKTNEKKYNCKKVVLACGIQDQLPDLPQIHTFYGKSVFHCPYCDAWEFSEKPWAIYATTRKAAIYLSRQYRQWTSNLTLLAAYTTGITRKDKLELGQTGVNVMDEPATKLDGKNGMLSSLFFSSTRIDCSVLFFSTGKAIVNPLVLQTGCRLTASGKLWCNRFQQTSVPGIYATGDASRDMPLAIIAAAEGAKAAVAINMDLGKS
jgi:thioredoxin reductase